MVWRFLQKLSTLFLPNRQLNQIDVEEIPNEDKVSRLLIFPRMFDEVEHLLWKKVFEFPKGRPESLVWHKYASTPDAIHELGLKLEEHIHSRKGDDTDRYRGYSSAETGRIRKIKTARGHGFSVIHEPKEGKHHTHVQYAPANGAEISSLTKADKGELKAALSNVFGELERYRAA